MDKDIDKPAILQDMREIMSRYGLNSSNISVLATIDKDSIDKLLDNDLALLTPYQWYNLSYILKMMKVRR